MRKTLASLAVTGVMCATGVAVATPAEAACPTIKQREIVEYLNDQWVLDRLQYLDCGPHIRVDTNRYLDSNGTRFITESDNFGRPSVYWYSEGVGSPVNGIDAYTHWISPLFWDLNNAICVKPCLMLFDGTMVTQDDGSETFYRGTYIN